MIWYFSVMAMQSACNKWTCVISDAYGTSVTKVRKSVSHHEHKEHQHEGQREKKNFSLHGQTQIPWIPSEIP